ncbi:MAG: tail fiber protein [Desulfovibrio sp.]|nr:tail fiber protein [Desulfovibrio sp.]
MALTSEESAKLNATLESCASTAELAERLLTSFNNGGVQNPDLAVLESTVEQYADSAVTTHNASAAAHSAMKSDAVNSSSSSTVATSKAVKTAYDLAASKTSQAYTMYVDAANGSDSNDGSSWAKAKKSIMNAYMAYCAMHCQNIYQVMFLHVAAGTYTENANVTLRGEDGLVLELYGDTTIVGGISCAYSQFTARKAAAATAASASLTVTGNCGVDNGTFSLADLSTFTCQSLTVSNNSVATISVPVTLHGNVRVLGGSVLYVNGTMVLDGSEYDSTSSYPVALQVGKGSRVETSQPVIISGHYSMGIKVESKSMFTQGAAVSVNIDYSAGYGLIQASTGLYHRQAGTLSLSGASHYMLNASRSGEILFDGTDSIALDGTTVAVVAAYLFGKVTRGGSAAFTSPNGVTGKRFEISLGGAVQTQSGGLHIFPGSTDGTVDGVVITAAGMGTNGSSYY